MAEFLRETAQIQFVWQRKRLPNGDEKKFRLPFDLVKYDNGQNYIEPINQGGPGAVQTFTNINNPATAGTDLVVDTDTFSELHQFRC